MRPRPLHSRTDLMRVLVDLAPSRAIKRAVSEGRFTILGGFTAPGDIPAIWTRVEGRFGAVWYLSLRVDQEKNRMYATAHNEDVVPWAYWDGTVCYPPRPLIDGDQPEITNWKYTYAKQAMLDDRVADSDGIGGSE